MAASGVVARGRRAAGDRRASTAEAAPAPRAGTDRADSDLRGTLGPRAEAAADTTPARAAAPQAVATATVASGASVEEPEASVAVHRALATSAASAVSGAKATAA